MNFVKKIAEFTYFHRLLFSVAAAVLCAVPGAPLARAH